MRSCSFKSLPTAAIQNNLGLAKMDPKPYLTFPPHNVYAINTISCVVSQGFP